MEIRSEVSRFIDSVDSFAQNRLTNKDDLAILVQLSQDQSKEQLLDDLTFHAKYVHRLYGIMQRTTPESDVYPKLSAEFTDGVEKVSSLMRTLVKEAPEEIKEKFKQLYFSMTHEGLQNLLNVAYDLSWIKNWNIDKGENSEEKGVR